MFEAFVIDLMWQIYMCARAPQSFFTETDNGSLLNRFSQDMTIIESQLPTGVLVTVSSVSHHLSNEMNL